MFASHPFLSPIRDEKRYVSIPVTIIPGPFHTVITSYLYLWPVGQSLRISKTDLESRPMFHRTRDSVESQSTAVFTALSLARFMHDTTWSSLKKFITTLRPLREFTCVIGDQEITFTPGILPAGEFPDALPTAC